jgi:hypothetical protein
MMTQTLRPIKEAPRIVTQFRWLVIGSCIAVLTLGIPRALAQGEVEPSISMTGVVSNDLNAAFKAWGRSPAQNADPRMQDFIVEVLVYPAETEVTFVPTLAGQRRTFAVKSGAAREVANPLVRSIKPLVIPGIIVSELAAVYAYADEKDGLGRQPWLASGEYELKLYIGGALLTTVFEPTRDASDSRSNAGGVCLAGCSNVVTYILRVRDSRFTIYRNIVL